MPKSSAIAGVKRQIEFWGWRPKVIASITWTGIAGEERKLLSWSAEPVLSLLHQNIALVTLNCILMSDKKDLAFHKPLHKCQSYNDQAKIQLLCSFDCILF